MLRKIMLVLSVVVMSLTIALPALAAAPTTGTVVEGVSVPGVALGDTRADVEAAYGQPKSCQDLSYYDGRRGVDGICDFEVDGGGQVTVYYFQDVDRNPAQGSPDDIALIIRWYEAVSGWTTTAGVNTTLAENDPEAVVDAYPNAVVTKNQFGAIIRVRDYEQGIEINWFYNIYNPNQVSVSMLIRPPSDLPPPREPSTHVTDIDLSQIKEKGQRKVTAHVRVRNDLELAASGATVTVSWFFPDGSSSQTAEAITSSSGSASFEINNAARGSYTLIVDDVVLDGHTFDRYSSVLSASINVK